MASKFFQVSGIAFHDASLQQQAASSSKPVQFHHHARSPELHQDDQATTAATTPAAASVGGGGNHNHDPAFGEVDDLVVPTHLHDDDQQLQNVGIFRVSESQLGWRQTSCGANCGAAVIIEVADIMAAIWDPSFSCSKNGSAGSLDVYQRQGQPVNPYMPWKRRSQLAAKKLSFRGFTKESVEDLAFFLAAWFNVTLRFPDMTPVFPHVSHASAIARRGGLGAADGASYHGGSFPPRMLKHVSEDADHPSAVALAQQHPRGILKEGWVYKRSRFLHVWRKRWFVLCADGTLCSFQSAANLITQSPTELWPIADIMEVFYDGDIKEDLPAADDVRGGSDGRNDAMLAAGAGGSLDSAAAAEEQDESATHKTARANGVVVTQSVPPVPAAAQVGDESHGSKGRESKCFPFPSPSKRSEALRREWARQAVAEAAEHARSTSTPPRTDPRNSPALSPPRRYGNYASTSPAGTATADHFSDPRSSRASLQQLLPGHHLQHIQQARSSDLDASSSSTDHDQVHIELNHEARGTPPVSQLPSHLELPELVIRLRSRTIRATPLDATCRGRSSSSSALILEQSRKQGPGTSSRNAAEQAASITAAVYAELDWVGAIRLAKEQHAARTQVRGGGSTTSTRMASSPMFTTRMASPLVVRSDADLNLVEMNGTTVAVPPSAPGTADSGEAARGAQPSVVDGSGAPGSSLTGTIARTSKSWLQRAVRKGSAVVAALKPSSTTRPPTGSATFFPENDSGSQQAPNKSTTSDSAGTYQEDHFAASQKEQQHKVNLKLPPDTGGEGASHALKDVPLVFEGAAAQHLAYPSYKNEGQGCAGTNYSKESSSSAASSSTACATEMSEAESHDQSDRRRSVEYAQARASSKQAAPVPRYPVPAPGTTYNASQRLERPSTTRHPSSNIVYEGRQNRWRPREAGDSRRNSWDYVEERREPDPANVGATEADERTQTQTGEEFIVSSPTLAEERRGGQRVA